MKKFIASLVAVAMIFAIGSTVWADDPQPAETSAPADVSVTADASATAEVTPGADETPTVDPNATPTPFDLYFDFNNGLEGWYGAFEDSGHKLVETGGIGNSGVMSVTYGTSKNEKANNGVHSGYYDIGDLVPGNIYEVSAKVKLVKGDSKSEGNLLITIIQCYYNEETKEWSYEALPAMANFTSALQLLPGEGDDTYHDAVFEFIAPQMDEGYDKLDKAQYPAYKFDILYMGGAIVEYYLDDLRIKDVTATSLLGKATPTPVATATPTTTPTSTPSPTATAAPTNKPTKKPVKSVKFTKKSVKIKKGKKVTLKVTIKGAKKATFSVDKKGKKVVKLSKKKAKSVVVTGKKKGKATITAKAAGKKATCKVTVK